MLELIKELEQRCPGCSFTVEDDPSVVRIVEYGRKFAVDLDGLGETAEEWLTREIDSHPLEDVLPLQPNDKYRVICKRCGIVVLGYGRYRDQMCNPDAHWFCPTCGGDADFDIVAYESYGERE